MVAALKEQFQHPKVKGVYVFGRSRKSRGTPVHNYAEAPRPWLYSILKTTRRVIRYLYDYWTNLQRLRSKGMLIIFDHYRFLLLALDPLKFRYGGPRRLLWWLFDVLPKPDVFIVLDVPMEVALIRKEEAPPDEISRLIADQKASLSRLKRVHIVDAARPLAIVTAEVFVVITGILDLS